MNIHVGILILKEFPSIKLTVYYTDFQQAPAHRLVWGAFELTCFAKAALIKSRQFNNQSSACWPGPPLLSGLFTATTLLETFTRCDTCGTHEAAMRGHAEYLFSVTAAIYLYLRNESHWQCDLLYIFLKLHPPSGQTWLLMYTKQ